MRTRQNSPFYLRWMVLVILALVSAACGSRQPPAEPTPTPTPTLIPTPTSEPAPTFGNFIPVGEPVYRMLGTSTEIVRNCVPNGETLRKNPSRSIMASYSVQWNYEGTTGVGVEIGGGVIPGGASLHASLSATYGQSFNESTMRGDGWELPSRAGQIVTYILEWSEVWQPGYVEVRIANRTLGKIDVMYRTNVSSEIVAEDVQKCDAGESAPISSGSDIVPQTSEPSIQDSAPSTSMSSLPGPAPLRQFNSEHNIPPMGQSTLNIKVNDGELHIVTSGPICVSSIRRCLPGGANGEKRGSVVVLLPSENTYQLTGLVALENWHGSYYGYEEQAIGMAEKSARDMLLNDPSNLNCGGGCEIVDMLVVKDSSIVASSTFR